MRTEVSHESQEFSDLMSPRCRLKGLTHRHHDLDLKGGATVNHLEAGARSRAWAGVWPWLLYLVLVLVPGHMLPGYPHHTTPGTPHTDTVRMQ